MGEWEESQRQASSSVNPARKICSARGGFCWCVFWWQKGGCILSTRKLKLTPRITLVIFFLNSSRTAISWCRRVYLSAYDTHCAGFAPDELSGFHRKGPVASKFARPKLLWTIKSGGDVGDLSQSPSKTKVNHRTQASAAGDSGRPTTETNRQGCQKLFKTIEKFVKA